MTAEHIDELLKIADSISRGEVPKLQENELFISGAFDLLLVKVRGAEAYELLSSICHRFEYVKTNSLGIQGYYYLLSLIARQTNTTEMPSGLMAIIHANPELSNELKDWYRC